MIISNRVIVLTLLGFLAGIFVTAFGIKGFMGLPEVGILALVAQLIGLGGFAYVLIITAINQAAANLSTRPPKAKFKPSIKKFDEL